MVEMTPERIKACYDLGKQVHNGKNRDAAAAELVDKHGMRESSAKMYTSAFLSIMKGGKLNWSLKQDYVIYYFKNAINDYGKEQVKISLESLETHIEYYFKKNGGTVPKLRKLYNEYSKEVGATKKL